MVLQGRETICGIKPVFSLSWHFSLIFGPFHLKKKYVFAARTHSRICPLHPCTLYRPIINPMQDQNLVLKKFLSKNITFYSILRGSNAKNSYKIQKRRLALVHPCVFYGPKVTPLKGQARAYEPMKGVQMRKFST